MARKFVHILFALLFIGTLFVMARLSWLDGDDPFYVFVSLLVLIPLSCCEYFFYRSILFLVSYPGDEPVALVASVISAVASAATLLYLVFCTTHGKAMDSTIFWFLLGVQFVCRLVVRILMRDVATNDSQEAVEQ